MTILIELDARPSLVPRSAGAAPMREAVDTRVANLAGRLQAAYAERLKEYQEQLTDALGANARYGFGAAMSNYPQVTIMLDGEETSLAIDDDLYTSLFDLYVFYGSKGLAAAEKAVHLGGSKGRDLVWLAARAFFRFTRNALVLVIREALIGIEASAAARVFDRLGQINRRIAKALETELRCEVVTEPEHEEVVLYSDAPVKIPVSYKYKLHDRSLAKALYTTMRAAVDAREAYNNLIAARRKLDDELAAAETAVANEESPGWRSPSSGDEGARSRRRRAELGAQAVEAKLPSAMRRLYDAQRQVYVNVPLALLVLPGLPPTFSTELMEDALGTALHELGQGVDRIAAATRSDMSCVRAELPGLRDSKPGAATPINPHKVEALYGPNFRIEHHLIGIATFKINENPSYIALLHSDTWRELIRNGVIGRDSFEYVIAYHWLAAIDEQAEEAAQRKAAQARSLMIASSGLSLLALVLPPLAPLALAADLSLLAFTMHGAARQLGGLADKLQIELPALASGGYEALAAVGELAAHISAVRENLTLDILKQLALLPLQRIRGVGQILQTRFYVDDAITLIREASNGP
jgi:hypothetical protein